MEDTGIDVIVAETCSKCSSDLDTQGYPKWCKGCRAKYQKEYVAVKATMETEQAYVRGIETMREHLAGEFAKHPRVTFSGVEVAGWITRAPRPAAMAPKQD